MLEWVVNAYLDHLDGLQQAVDDLEVSILRGGAGNDAVGQLVELRHDIGRLRRRLSPHRQVFATLAHPSFDVISGSSASRDFGILVDRLEMAVQAVDSTREMIVGAFDVFMTQTAQRTNNIMRVLTIVSLTLLPATLIAGIMGMNMLPEVPAPSLGRRGGARAHAGGRGRASRDDAAASMALMGPLESRGETAFRCAAARRVV